MRPSEAGPSGQAAAPPGAASVTCARARRGGRSARGAEGAPSGQARPLGPAERVEAAPRASFAHSGERAEPFDASGASDANGPCESCLDAASVDADGGSMSSVDGSSDVDEAAVPLSACQGSLSGLVIVDPGDPYFDEDLHQFSWMAWLGPRSSLDLAISEPTLAQNWSLIFATAADAGSLGVGTYDNAGFPASSNMPELVIAGDGMGCDETTGSFQIDTFDLDDAGAVRTFAATYAQQCVGPGGGGLTLTGCVYVSR
jgi:hypothetical protein